MVTLPGAVTAVDIGGTHVSSAIVDPALGIHEERRVPLDADGGVDDLLDRIAECASDHNRGTDGVAVAIPGPFDYARGVGDFQGVAKFGLLSGVDVRAALAERWDRPPDRLRFLNDAEAFGLGEWVAGAGERAGRCVALTLGTGVGSAFIDHGRCVSSGPQVPDDGNLHTVEVDGVPLEERVSRRALMQSYRDRTGRDADVADIAGRARAGDRQASDVLAAGMRTLGRALAPWLVRFGVDRLVVGGSMAESADLLFPPLRRQLTASTGTAARIRRGVLPAERASMIGAVVGTSRP